MFGFEAWLIQTLNQNGIVVEVSVVASSNRKSVIHVLHVDDDPSTLEISKKILMDMGTFEIDNACRVDEALKKLSTGQFDVVISDYEMPQKDGLQFLKELREKNNKIPFILFTGKGREEVAIKALNLGADSYLNKQGDPETVYGELVHELTQSVKRKQAEEALLESETKFRLYVEHSPVAVFVVNPEGKYEYANQAASELLGYSINELQTMSIPQITYDPDLQIVVQSFMKLKEIGFFHEETRRKSKGGDTVFVDLNAVALPNGKLMAFCENITESKKKEDMLCAREKRFRAIFDKSFQFVLILDTNGNILEMNKLCYTVHGPLGRGISGKPFLGGCLVETVSRSSRQSKVSNTELPEG